jgi:hypothetical protein
VFTLELNDFTSFLEKCGIPDNESQFVKKSDCDTLFITSNYMGDKSDPEAKVRTEHSMLEQQFIEALVRIALAKYGKGQSTANVITAVEMLIVENILPNIPGAATVDNNWFRRERLYFEEVDTVYKRVKPALLALYSRYRLPPKAGGLRPKLWNVDCWMEFCKDANLIDEEYTLPNSQLVYLQSRMTVVDEVGRWSKYTVMTWVDFLEAFGRTADQKSIPSLAEIHDMGYENMLDWKLAIDAGEIQYVRRPSATGHHKPTENIFTRPLADKVEALLDLAFRTLCYIPGEENPYSVDIFTRKMKKIDHALGS